MTEKRSSSGQVDKVVVTRVLNAPIALVFKVWTDPAHVNEWWGPHHFTNRVKKWEPRAGGKIDVEMIGPDGSVYPMTGAFREVREPEKLVFTASALDAQGNPLFENLNTITLVSTGEMTTITVTAKVLTQGPNAEQYLKGMEAGWTQSLEKLETHLTGSGGKA